MDGSLVGTLGPVLYIVWARFFPNISVQISTPCSVQQRWKVARRRRRSPKPLSLHGDYIHENRRLFFFLSLPCRSGAQKLCFHRRLEQISDDSVMPVLYTNTVTSEQKSLLIQQFSTLHVILGLYFVTFFCLFLLLVCFVWIDLCPKRIYLQPN